MKTGGCFIIYRPSSWFFPHVVRRRTARSAVQKPKFRLVTKRNFGSSQVTNLSSSFKDQVVSPLLVLRFWFRFLWRVPRIHHRRPRWQFTGRLRLRGHWSGRPTWHGRPRCFKGEGWTPKVALDWMPKVATRKTPMASDRTKTPLDQTTKMAVPCRDLLPKIDPKIGWHAVTNFTETRRFKMNILTYQIFLKIQFDNLIIQTWHHEAQWVMRHWWVGLEVCQKFKSKHVAEIATAQKACGAVVLQQHARNRGDTSEKMTNNDGS